MVDVLVLNFNDAVTTTSFVQSVKDYSCVRKILVVDNHSKDNSLELLKALENEKIIVVDSGKNGGYGFGNNFGVHYLYDNYNSEHILVCNPDVAIAEDFISRLSEYLKNNSEYAVVAPMMNIPGKGAGCSVFKDAKILSFIMAVEQFFSKKYSPLYLDVSKMKDCRNVDVFSVAGSLFMIDAKKFLDIGGYDEQIFLYFEEFILGKKCKSKNYKIALLPDLSFLHNHSVSISKSYKSVLKRQRIYLRSYRYVVKHYFNSNIFYYALSYLMSMVSLLEVFVWSQLKRAKQKCL